MENLNPFLLSNIILLSNTMLLSKHKLLYLSRIQKNRSNGKNIKY